MSNVRKPSEKRKAGPAPPGKPKADPAAAARNAQREAAAIKNVMFKDNTFPDAGVELFDAMLAKVEWHLDQMQQQVRVMKANGDNVENMLRETANDARDVWAICELLYWQGGTVR